MQEIKCENKFFQKNFNNIGYASNIHGEKGKNGVAILINESISRELENVQIIDLSQPINQIHSYCSKKNKYMLFVYTK